MAALHDGAKGFPSKRKPIIERSAKATSEGTTISFPNLTEGTYAVTIYHDENGDHELDTNFFGIPKEGLGVSNNAKGSMGPPSFKDAAIQVSDIDINIEISIGY